MMKLLEPRSFTAQCAAEFRDRRFAAFHIPGSWEIAREAAEQFQKFLLEPEEAKYLWDFADPDGKSNDGWVRRKNPYETHRGFGRSDLKDWWHWSPRMFDLMRERGLHGLQKDLVEVSEACWQYQEKLWFAICEVLDEVIPNRQLAMLARHPSSQRMSSTRLIVYRPVESGAVMGEWHADRSDATLHMFNSRNCLRIGSQRIPWEAGVDDILFFAGEKARKSMGISELMHGAIEGASSTEAIVPRLTVVHFCHINHALFSG
ncbi:MAG: hypothetical protein U1A26_01630 [Candidatus Sungbacteria bacterium]|nr:hypothetical protein [Candidatus Sungbacteria bacterium]